MPKSTVELVFEAADELLKEGVRPSQQNVRTRIGKGSATTIHRALNEWWQQLALRLQPQQEADGVPQALSQALAEIWHDAQQRARDQLSEQEAVIRQSLQKEREQLDIQAQQAQQQAEEVMAKLERAYQRVEALQAELQTCQRENINLEKQLVKESARLSELQRSDKTQRKVIERLERQLTQVSAAQPTPGAVDQNMELKPPAITSGASDPVYSQLAKENDYLKSTVSNLDNRLAEKDNLITNTQQQLLDLKRRFYRLESGVEGSSALKEAGYQGQLDAKDREIERLLALVADKR